MLILDSTNEMVGHMLQYNDPSSDRADGCPSRRFISPLYPARHHGTSYQVSSANNSSKLSD